MLISVKGRGIDREDKGRKRKRVQGGGGGKDLLWLRLKFVYMYIFFRSRGKCHRKFVSGNPLGRPRPKPTTNKQNSPADMVKGRGGGR